MLPITVRNTRKMKRSTSPYKWLPLALAFVAFTFFVGIRFSPRVGNAPASFSKITHSAAGRAASAQTLVVYIFSKTDTEYENNLRFFLKHGVAENDGCDYIFILQDIEGVPTPDISKIVPSNARIEHHPNGCYDWGTIGWLLENRNVDTSKYKYFIFMNSSVRGPFIPAYTQGQPDAKRWHEHITSRINDKVKLVGPTISCEGSPKEGNVAGEWRTNPHVQSYVLGTDQVGLKIWLDDGKVFGCYSSMWDTIYYSELGSSLAILREGYNLESFMLRYKGIDWQNQANWGCNNRTNPYGENYYDGISLSPYEVMFVKVKGMLLQNEWSYARIGKKYDEWMSQQAAKGVAEIASNVWKSNPWPLKAAKVAYARARGSQCFDVEYYRTHNKDLAPVKDDAQLWEHYVMSGQFEGRPFSFKCETKIA